MNKYFYHFTHLDNLDSIIKNGLLCTKNKDDKGISHYNIANKTIQGRRSEMDVVCDGQNFGKVHDFVPFYFSTKNPMQLAIINQKKVDQPELIFFGVKTSLIESKKFIFTNSSANSVIPPSFYNDIKYLDQLDWDIINSYKWSFNEVQKQKRMAEVLVKDFKFEYIDHIVVFNEFIKNEVEKIFEDNNISNKPRIEFEPVENKRFYFTKFFFKGRENEDLVTGPKRLKYTFDSLTRDTIEKRATINSFKYKSIRSLLSALDENFSVLPETAGIFKLETVNDFHTNTVSEHTTDVLNNLKNNAQFKALDEKSQEILLISAFLHDIGKGPKSKWKYGKQEVYNDHPYDSLIYTQRVLIEDIEELTNEDVRLINLLVGYHDILGDLCRDHRNTIELRNIITTKNDLELLYILSQADVLALRQDWYDNLCCKFEEIKSKVLK